MSMTKTQTNQHARHQTPHKLSPLWFEDPPTLTAESWGEDKEDKKTPSRLRDVRGDFYVLVETISYLTFPPPEVRAALKKAGKPVTPFRIFQVYIHLMHAKTFSVRTIKAYKHQKNMLYTDSWDFEIISARKGTAPRDRETAVKVLAGCFKIAEDEASALMSAWTCGN